MFVVLSLSAGMEDKLTPLRLCLSIICEDGEPDLRQEVLMWLKRKRKSIRRWLKGIVGNVVKIKFSGFILKFLLCS